MAGDQIKEEGSWLSKQEEEFWKAQSDFLNVIMLGNTPTHSARIVDGILSDQELFNKQTIALRQKAPTFPRIYFEDKYGCTWATTMVEFSYKNKKYRRHHVESIIPNEKVTINSLQNMLVERAQQTISQGIPTSFDHSID